MDHQEPTKASSSDSGEHPPICDHSSTEHEAMDYAARFMSFHDTAGSPYFGESPFLDAMEKTKTICDEINQLTSMPNERRLSLLVEQYMAQMLPLTRLKQYTLDAGLSLLLYRELPRQPHELVRHFVPDIYKRQLEAIQQAVANRRIFLSYTIESFNKSQQDEMHKQLEAHSTEKDQQFGDYLFAIVGIYGKDTDQVEKRFVLKVEELNEDKKSKLSKRVGELIHESLKLLYPNLDKSPDLVRGHFVHLLADPELDFSASVSELSAKYPSLFGQLLYVPYVPRVLAQISVDIRHRLHGVVGVIDSVRMQWIKSEAFRKKFHEVSLRSLPEEFNASVQFCVEHYRVVESSVRKWQSRQFDHVQRAFMKANFFNKIKEFAAGPNKILNILDQMNHTWWDRGQELSVRIVKIGQVLQQTVEQQTVEKIDSNNQDPKKLIVQNSLELNLITDLIGRLFPALRPVLSTKLAQCHLMDALSGGLLEDTRTTLQNWAPPLIASQMVHTFPRFMYMFRKTVVPLVWEQMDSCALVYCSLSEEKSKDI